jgi:hypothetical protein
VPEMLKLVWSRERRRELSIMSKAALGSSGTSNEGWLLSAAWQMLFRLTRRAASVE